MANAIETEVLIVGAGPAGLSLAADLGSKGIRHVVIEQRTEVTEHPRATLLGARSMEYFRRLGLAESLIDAGLPSSYRYDVIFATRLSGHVLHHYSSPSADEYRKMANGRLPATPESRTTPYFKVQIGQHQIEPILRAFVSTLPSGTLRYGTELIDFRDDEDGVTAVARDVTSGEMTEIAARYMAACDGGRGIVRDTLGVSYVGRGAMRRNISYLFRSHDFLNKATVGRGNLYFTCLPGSFGVFTMIDDVGTWNYQHYMLDKDDQSRDSIDPAHEIRKAMGCDFDFEIQHTMRWSHHQSVAERFRSGHVFLLGDAAHLFSPTGGVGMNTAIGDAFDLGWKLTAVLRGWGGASLLDSYEAERWPIGFRNTLAAATNADRIDAMMRMTKPEVEDDGDEGERFREEMKPRFRWLARQFNTFGLHVGYRYADSPLIISDATPEPPDDPVTAVQSTWPGCRMPHAWLADGTSTLDVVDGTAFVLVSTGAGDTSDADSLDIAARELGVPLRRAHFSDPRIAALYERPLVLVRPDGHVCWRDEHVDGRAVEILNTVRGGDPVRISPRVSESPSARKALGAGRGPA